MTTNTNTGRRVSHFLNLQWPDTPARFMQMKPPTSGVYARVDERCEEEGHHHEDVEEPHEGNCSNGNCDLYPSIDVVVK